MQKAKNRKQKANKLSGFTIIEVIIACTIISVTILTLTQAAAKGIELSLRSLNQTEASMLLEEGAEAVKTIRDTSWDNISGLTPETDYYLTFDSGLGAWSLGMSPTPLVDSIFDRKVIISEVLRDSDGNISEVGNIDPGTKKVTINVVWIDHGVSVSKNLVLYLADVFN